MISIQTQQSEFKAMLTKHFKTFAAVMGNNEEKAKTFLGHFSMVLIKNPKIMQCDPEQVLGAAFLTAQRGLNPDQGAGEVWYIPHDRKDKDGNIIGTDLVVYMGKNGLKKGAFNMPGIKSIHTRTIYKDSIFTDTPISEMKFENNAFYSLSRFSVDPNPNFNSEKDELKAIGYLAWYEKIIVDKRDNIPCIERFHIYIPYQKMYDHASKTSKSFKKKWDKAANKYSDKDGFFDPNSAWAKFFDEMAEGVALKRLSSIIGYNPDFSDESAYVGSVDSNGQMIIEIKPEVEQVESDPALLISEAKPQPQAQQIQTQPQPAKREPTRRTPPRQAEPVKTVSTPEEEGLSSEWFSTELDRLFGKSKITKKEFESYKNNLATKGQQLTPEQIKAYSLELDTLWTKQNTVVAEPEAQQEVIGNTEVDDFENVELPEEFDYNFDA